MTRWFNGLPPVFKLEPLPSTENELRYNSHITTIGKRVFTNFISSRDEVEKVQKLDRDERTPEDYPTFAKIHSSSRVVLLHSFPFLPSTYFSGPSVLEMKLCGHFIPSFCCYWRVSKPTSK